MDENEIDCGEMTISYEPLVGAPKVLMHYESEACKFLIKVSPQQALMIADELKLCAAVNETYLLHAGGADGSDVIMEIEPDKNDAVVMRLTNAAIACSEFILD